MVVVEEPAVEAGLADCRLDRFKVHTGHDTRLGKRSTSCRFLPKKNSTMQGAEEE
jgi:hypothetical protein